MVTPLMMSFSLHVSKTHFQVYFRGFMASDPEIWHEGEIVAINSCLTLKLTTKHP